MILLESFKPYKNHAISLAIILKNRQNKADNASDRSIIGFFPNSKYGLANLEHLIPGKTQLAYRPSAQDRSCQTSQSGQIINETE